MGMYNSYKCTSCSGEFVLPNEYLEKQEKANRYLVCHYCSSRKVRREKVADSVRECMKERSYRRRKGSLIEIK